MPEFEKYRATISLNLPGIQIQLAMKYTITLAIVIVSFLATQACSRMDAGENEVARNLAPTPSEEVAADVARAFMIAMDADDRETLRNSFADGGRVFLSSFSEPLDVDGWLQDHSTWVSASTGMIHVVQDLIVSGKSVTMRGTIALKHTGEMMGIPASNKDVRTDWLSIHEYGEEGKITKLWVQYDQVSLMKQMGGCLLSCPL